MNSTDMADLYADLSAVLAALTNALQAKGLLTNQDITNAARLVLQDVAQPRRTLGQGNPHPYLMLRELAARD